MSFLKPLRYRPSWKLVLPFSFKCKSLFIWVVSVLFASLRRTNCFILMANSNDSNLSFDLGFYFCKRSCHETLSINEGERESKDAFVFMSTTKETRFELQVTVLLNKPDKVFQTHICFLWCHIYTLWEDNIHTVEM